MVNEKNFNKWLTALESDEFDQAHGALVNTAVWWEDGDWEDKDLFRDLYGRVEPLGFCCLGVAECVRLNPSKIGPKDKWANSGLASRRTLHWLGIPLLDSEKADAKPLTKDDAQYDIVVVDSRGRKKPHTKSAAQRNDGGQDFKEIALWLSENRDRLRGENGD